MNKNIKKLIRKLSSFEDFYDAPRNLRDLFLTEIVFADLIVPGTDIDDDYFSIKYFDSYGDKVDMCVFTDLEEFKKNISDGEPFTYSLLSFENNVYTNILYLTVNNSYKIPMNIIWSRLEEESTHKYFTSTYSHDYTREDTLKLIESYDNELLISYVNGRKQIQSYIKLFHIMEDSVLFCDIDSDNSFSITDDHISVYTDLNMLKLNNYSVVDWFELIEFVIKHELKGIFIETQSNSVKLSRNQLVKNFSNIRKSHFKFNRTNTFQYVFDIE